MMGLDLLVFGRHSHHVSFRESAIRSVAWIGASLAFNAFIYVRHGSEMAVPFFLAYVVEKSLSVDNLFVFLAVFSYFKVPDEHQQRVLFWGVFGAVVMRAIFILLGAALLTRFSWMMYFFGGFLIYTGVKLAVSGEDDDIDPANSPALRFAKRFLRTTPKLDGERFFTVKDGVRYATPLFLVLIVIEFTDLLFAVDSVPAVLAISDDLFIVYASNIFAIMGLRSLYFMLSGMMGRFHYLSYGLAGVLTFIGVKMVAHSWIHIGNWVSLGVIGGLLSVSVIASLLRKPGHASDAGDALTPQDQATKE
ncbi:MAG: TerC family protein [Myxococcales bacterium]|nr:TerC family protein [Myxococcales bacterium]